MAANKKSVQIGLGISSILMIFVVLCMMILSLLSYRETTQKYTITQRQKEYQEQYAQVDAHMQYVWYEMQVFQYDNVRAWVENETINNLLKEFEISYEIQEDVCILKKHVNDGQELMMRLVMDNHTLRMDAYQIVS